MNSVVYHAGDFSRKSERIGSMTSGRSTGFFGTGYYFTLDWKKCAYLDDGERPLYSLNIEDYNLIYGTTSLHRALRNVNRYVSWLPYLNLNLEGLLNVIGELKRFSKTTYNLGESDFPKALEKLCREFQESEEDEYEDVKDFYINDILDALEDVDELKGLYDILNAEDYPDFEEVEDYFYDNRDILSYGFLENVLELKDYGISEIKSEFSLSDSEISSICKKLFNDVYEIDDLGNFDYHRNVDDDSDSITTRFLKKLGYEGVYPSEECDNTTYGGVIFDLDKAKDVKLLSKVAKEYKESKGMNRTRFFEDIYNNSNFEDFWDKAQIKIKQYNVDDKLDFVKEELEKEVEKFNNKEFGEDAEVLFKARVDTIFHRVGLVEKESEPLAFAIYDILVGEDDDD